MAMDMRALYYIALPLHTRTDDEQALGEFIKANENCLNQNFTILTKKLEEMEQRLSGIENQA